MIGAMQALRVTAQLSTRVARQVADELRREGWGEVTEDDVRAVYERWFSRPAYLRFRIGRALAERGVLAWR